MEGVLLVGGRRQTKPARPLSVHPEDRLGTYPWDKALHGGVCICSALCAPSVTYGQESLQFPECATLCLQNTCTPSRHTSHSSLKSSSRKPRRSPGWVLCPSEVPRSSMALPMDALCWNKTPIPHLPCVRASSPGLDTLVHLCVCGMNTRADASQQSRAGSQQT